MAPSLLVFAILASCSGLSSQATLTQPPSHSVSLGQTAKVSCAIGGSVGNFHWLRQRPGQGPHFVLYSSTRGEGIPDRFSDSSSGSPRYLTIMNVQAEDEAVYYCSAWDGTGSMWIFGGGTRLQVTGQPTSPPTVNLFSPPAKDMQNEQKAMLVCLMDNFNPGEVTVTWEADGATISTGVETTVPVKHNTNYMASSYLTLDTSKWQSHERFTCKVTHKGTEYPKTINRSECP